MVRCFLIVLPLCLFMQGQDSLRDLPPLPPEYHAVKVTDKSGPELKSTDLPRQHLLGGMALATAQPFPGSLPWAPLHEVGTGGLYPVESLIHYQSLLFLEMCLDRYKREVKGYTTKFVKREKLGGKLETQERIDAVFREQPFSVFMSWQEGPRKGQKVLYVAGENNGKLLARGAGFVAGLTGIWEKDIHGVEAKQNGRYTIDEFGIYLGTRRTLAALKRAEARGALHFSYHGVFRVLELGDRPCYKFVRTDYDPPEPDGENELTIFIDQENWLQTGSILKDVHGNVIAEYYFRDIKLNPEIKKEQFTRAAL
jgi:hypothetical protein